MDDSIKFNLRNPALTDDIGYSMINRMYPGTVNPITGTIDNSLGDVNFNNGQPAEDMFKQSQKDADKQKFSKLLVGAVAVIAALFVFKKSSKLSNFASGLLKKTGINTAGTKILTKVKNIFSKGENGAKNFGEKAKSITSNFADKVKNTFGKSKNSIIDIFKKIKK